MNNVNPTIKFQCPGCGQDFEGDESLEFEKFTCTTCQHEFYPKAQKTIIPGSKPAVEVAPTPAPKPEKKLPTTETAAEILEYRRAGIRNKAQIVEYIAIALFCIGCLAALLSVAAIIGENPALIGWVITSCAFGSAIWFYMIAQIIHVRANTEK